MELMLQRLTDIEKIRDRGRDTKKSNDDSDTYPVWCWTSAFLRLVEMWSVEDSLLFPELLYEKEYAVADERRGNREDDEFESK